MIERFNRAESAQRTIENSPAIYCWDHNHKTKRVGETND
jgi:hypothetical protein